MPECIFCFNVHEFPVYLAKSTQFEVVSNNLSIDIRETIYSVGCQVYYTAEFKFSGQHFIGSSLNRVLSLINSDTITFSHSLPCFSFHSGLTTALFGNTKVFCFSIPKRSEGLKNDECHPAHRRHYLTLSLTFLYIFVVGASFFFTSSRGRCRNSIEDDLCMLQKVQVNRDQICNRHLKLCCYILLPVQKARFHR